MFIQETDFFKVDVKNKHKRYITQMLKRRLLTFRIEEKTEQFYCLKWRFFDLSTVSKTQPWIRVNKWLTC